MQKNFDAYGKYYDLLYSDKDYEAEAKYVLDLLRKENPKQDSLLELGCGTGRHATLFAQSGLEVTGVERSERMLEEGKKRTEQPPGRDLSIDLFQVTQLAYG